MSVRTARWSVTVLATTCVAVLVTPAVPALAVPTAPTAAAARAVPAASPAVATAARIPTAVGYGGAVSSVDPDATRVGLDVLRRGGNAVDAAVATAATLGVTEPYSSGIGGGGFFVYYDARTHRISTIDGRETAPAAFSQNVFVENGQPIPFAEAVTSGLSVGVPGSLATWQTALSHWGTTRLAAALGPAIEVARRGFVVDATFRQQTADNAARFSDFPATRALFLPGGAPPAVGSIFRNPALADTYQLLARQGAGALYGGQLGRELVQTVRNPPVDPAATRPVRKGLLTTDDLAAYTTRLRAPTHVSYRGLDVYGMAPPSSGGSTVGEALNILRRFNLAGMSTTEAYHHYLEASRLAFADRNRWVGDPDAVNVPLAGLLSDRFAAERACLIDPSHALTSPVAPGDPTTLNRAAGRPCRPAAAAATAQPSEGLSTTNLTVADRWGNVVEYTLTIEQTGGSAITLPGRGFLLNNELTDFDFVPITAGVPDPNLPGPGKRPRSSISPTIVLRDGQPLLAVGSPGGATIITTVLQILIGRLDLGLSLPEAIAAPRASQRNQSSNLADAEPGFLALPQAAGLRALGQGFSPVSEIGAATGIEFLRGRELLAAAEPVRRGGGAAAVVHPIASG